MKKYKTLIIFILIPLLLGTIVGFVTAPNSNIDSIIPSWIFPVVWTILYILMGVSSYLVFRDTGEIPKIYIIQLGVNLAWSFIFFTFQLFTVAYIWILLLILLVIIMIKEFLERNKLAGFLQIPYLIWLFIASFLNYIIMMK